MKPNICINGMCAWWSDALGKQILEHPKIKEKIKEANKMTLTLDIHSAYCVPAVFIINGEDAEESDFGERGDTDPVNADSHCCGNMQFERIEPTDAVLKKYDITVAEYNDVAEQLESGLSFGACNLCS